MRVPILTYHSMSIGGTHYSNNDLIALREDLQVIDRLRFRIVPLIDVVQWWLQSEEIPERIVAITCDDGSDFDYRDLPHPSAGTQRSVLNILQDFQLDRPGAQPDLSITSFVIVSPEARKVLDRTCMIGEGWWNDDWWADAAGTGLMGIANHSWDHNHETLPDGVFPGVARGSFESIDTFELADFQIAQASDYLWRVAPNRGAHLFAYPYGKANAFLSQHYFPQRAASINLFAAFADDPEPLHSESKRWELPRYVFRRDWTSTTELASILRY
jgi:peptidoglycan/xylan/chitin deacetylase (PgdA/CDA1 family)